MLYSSGVVNYALKDAAFGAFVLFYYKQVLGLSGTLTGLAIALSVVWDAISDPLVGALSDNLRSRWGRRHPLMLISVIPLALGFISLFSPPDFAVATQNALFLWLLGSVILLRTALTFFMVPYLALGAEITSDYHERTRLAGARTNLGWFIGVLVPSGALLLLFDSGGGVDGRFVIDNYHRYGILNACAAILFSIICIRGTWHHIPMLIRRTTETGGSMVGDILTTFKNRNFRYLVILDMAIGGLGGILGALLMVTFTYFWELDTAQVSLLFGGPPILAVVAVGITSGVLNRRLEKQRILQWSCLLGAINLAWLTPMKMLGWLSEPTDFVFTLVFLNYAIFVTMTILRTIASHAMLADIADEQELATGQRQEGVMFAAAFFSAKFISGFGYLVAGPFLDWIGLEAGVQVGEAPPGVIQGLGMIMGPGLALVMLIPFWASLQLRLSHASQLAVQEALRERTDAS